MKISPPISSGNSFLENIKSAIQEISYAQIPNYTLLLVSIKNYEQINSLISGDHIVEINHIIKSSIEDVILSQSCYVKIFSNEKYYYCLMKNNNYEDIERLSYEIHKSLLKNSFMSIFADSRFIALPLTPEIGFDDYITLISDQNYYSDRTRVFTWIENPKNLLRTISDDYQMLGELRNAINKKTICFAFQPIISCVTGKISYQECLLRLNNIDYELISAGRYIVLAEKYGYISLIDEHVIEMVVDELNNSENIKLSVNISNIGVQTDSIIYKLKDLLTNYNVGERLILEITETAVNNNFEKTKSFIETAKNFGCRIALDDFGVGYTSFNQIRKLPIDIIKIDGSFVKDIVNNNKNRFFVENLIRTACELNCKTVAEYVENGEIAKLLIEMEVDFMQGNFFSPAKNFRSWPNKNSKEII